MARKPNKTVNVNKVLEKLNLFLKDSNPEMQERRSGIIFALETMLFEANSYEGFRYLTQEETTGNPGVVYKDGVPHPDIELRFKDTDRTRVQYF